MSLRRNVTASYISQIYVSLVGIVMVPTYLRYMGVEAYGLVGFFAMLQAWFQLLDMGLSPTLSRETARYVGGATDALRLRRLLRVLEAVFVGVAVAGTLALVLGAQWVASHWLQVEHLPLAEVRLSVQLMALIIGLRWVAGLYRGALAGFEQQVWLGRLNIAVATARFIGVVPIFMFVGTTPVLFFGFQLLVALVETAVLTNRTYRQFPRLAHGERVGFHWRPLQSVLRFSLSIAFTGAVWVAVTQTDKLLLSKLLPLAEYAWFTLAVIVASGVQMISGPLSLALLPRLSRMQAEGQADGLIALYRQATQGMAVIVIPAAVMLACAAEPVLRALTGDAALAAQAGPILRLYALGNGVLALGAFPYYLQFAKGDVRLHLIGNALFLVLLIPSILVATRQYGALGAGGAWLGANLVYGLCWVPLVHRRFAPGLHLRWMLQDVLPIAVLASATAVTLTQWTAWPANRAEAGALFCLLGAVTLVAAALASSQVRTFLRTRRTRHTAMPHV